MEAIACTDPDPRAAPPLVTVCLCTYRRPFLLERLLDALAAQVGLPGAFDVAVVDNDVERSAAPVLHAARRRHPTLALRAASEPRKNIALARNRTVGLATGEWIAFVDDDEAPGPGWLAALHRTAIEFGADGVCAPVVPEVAPDAAPWIERGHFFERPRHRTGAAVPANELRTGNLLVRRSLLIEANGDRSADPPEGPFDPSYGTTGGEDSDLLGRLSQGGARFVWCDEAPVHEVVPSERATLRYLLETAFATGHTHARKQMRTGGQRAVAELLVRGGGAAGAGGVLALATLPLGLHRSVHWARVALAGAGKLVALTGRLERIDRR